MCFAYFYGIAGSNDVFLNRYFLIAFSKGLNNSDFYQQWMNVYLNSLSGKSNRGFYSFCQFDRYVTFHCYFNLQFPGH